jgi:hypothetical protein
MFLFLSRLFWLPVSPEECIEVSPSEPEPESELASGGCTLGTCKQGQILKKLSDFMLIQKFKEKKRAKNNKVNHKNAQSSNCCSSERYLQFFYTLQP